jgi:hypothetical protein
MKKKLFVLIIAFFTASVTSLYLTDTARSTNEEHIKEYPAPKRFFYENMSYSFTFDVDVNFSRDGTATPVISNLQKRNSQAWGPLAVRAWVTNVSKDRDMVVVEIEAEARGYGQRFSSSYGQPVKWGKNSENETRLEFKDMIYFPFDRYPDLARMEHFEPGGVAELSVPEEPAPSKPEQVMESEERLTKIITKEGMVRIKKANGEWVNAEAGMELEIGDTIKTLSNGKIELTLAGTAIIRVRPESEFIIPEDKSNTTEKVGFIKMVKGVLWAHAKIDKNSLKVATPNAVCGVRGTEFEVSFKDSITCVEVFEGTVWLSSSEDAPKTAINAGQKACIPAGGQQAITPQPQSGTGQLSGTWKTDFGMVTFTQAGNVVTGSYTHDNGKIEGTLEGNILRGRWSESPSYKPPKDAGDLEFTFSEDGRKFTGTWRYGFDKQTWDGKWTGTKE